MEYLDLTIKEMHELLKNGEITPLTLSKAALERAYKYQSDYNSFVTILDDALNAAKDLDDNVDNPLYGIPYALKDNISTKGILTTASSNILKDYVPVFDATVVTKLKEKKAVLIGKTVLDELAMGGSGTTGHTGIVCNPWDKERMIGGSSAGSAAAVALGIVPFALGSDTGDSIRKPAAYGGLVGFKPTYGRISRYGLFPFASSLDHFGCLTRWVEDAAYVIDALKGKDEKDMTSLPDDNKIYSELLDGKVKGKKLFYIKEIIDIDTKDINQEVQATLDNFNFVLEQCKELGIEVEAVSIEKKLLNALHPTYITISCAEVTSNNANLTGIIFGNRQPGDTVDEVMFNTRTDGFSELIKRRFVIGSYVLQKENQEKLFLNACRVRRIIVDKITELFKKYDGLILPATGGIAPKFDQKFDKLLDRYLLLENHLVIGNFGGFPSITIPSGVVSNMPIGVNITGPILKDSEVLNMAYALESQLGYKGIMAKGGNKNV
jgi:aspartyl-tRNA(Asn)/glutamyl-tRNA(Gln) amidotransferase subunit A